MSSQQTQNQGVIFSPDFVKKPQTKVNRYIKPEMLAKRFKDNVSNLEQSQTNDQIKKEYQPQNDSKFIKQDDSLFNENQKVNIFQNPVVPGYEQTEAGPAYDKNGELIKYSVAGRSEWFLYQDKVKKGIIRDETEEEKLQRQRSITQELKNTIKQRYRSKTIKQFQKKEQRESLKNQIKDESDGYPRQFDATSERMEYVNEKVTHSEVNQQIEELLQRVQQNKALFTKSGKLVLKSLQVGERLSFTQDERIMDKFQHQQKKWEFMINDAARQTHRQFDNSVYMQSESYRAQKEYQRALDLLIPDSQRYGDKYWFMTLRQYGNQIARRPSQRILDDLPHGFNTFLPPKQDSQFEIIRKPQTHRLKSKFEGLTSFNSQRSKAGNYLQNRILNADKTVNVSSIKALGHSNDIDQIEVQGQNVLTEEIRTAQKLIQQGKPLKLKKLKEDVDKQNIIEEDVIEAQFETSRLSKLGSTALRRYTYHK